MSVRITRMCIPTSYARYSAAVKAIRGVMSRSTAGSSARFRKRTARRSAPVRSKSSMKTRASSCVIPIAAKTTPKGSRLPRTLACRAICKATSFCGRPAPEHSGSFSTKISGPAISVMVRYSVGISGSPQSFELVVHLGDRLPELFVEFRFVLHPRQEFAGLQRRDLLRRDVQFHGLLTEVGVFLDRADQLELPLGRAERVDRMIRVLLEEDFADHPGDLERELLVRRQGVRADETDDFLELRLFLQRPLRPRSQLRPVLVHVLPEPVLQDLRVQAVRLKPVDRREMPPSPQGGVQCPEHLHDAEGALGDGLREVPAARGHRTDDADGPFQASQGLRP